MSLCTKNRKAKLKRLSPEQRKARRFTAKRATAYRVMMKGLRSISYPLAQSVAAALRSGYTPEKIEHWLRETMRESAALRADPQPSTVNLPIAA